MAPARMPEKPIRWAVRLRLPDGMEGTFYSPAETAAAAVVEAKTKWGWKNGRKMPHKRITVLRVMRQDR